MSRPREGPVLALVGPTAVGKSEIAVDVAQRLGCEIVSVDSMQIYRKMDSGTAKPPAELRTRVPHHLVDEVDPDAEVTVADYQKRARAAIAAIHGRGTIPLLVGGSGLYFRAVVDDLDFPPSEPELRTSLENEFDTLGARALFHRLQTLDPEAAARIDPNNKRRIVRALEVIELTGRRFSDNQSWKTYASRYDLTVAGLELAREILFARITGRVDAMLRAGLVGEARSLERRGMSRTARQALGYRQVLDAPQDAPEHEIRAEIVKATKRFARRQES